MASGRSQTEEMPRVLTAIAVLSASLAGTVHGAEISWEPAHPTPEDEISVILRDSGQGATLHWGINGRGSTWQRPPENIVPTGTVYQGVAARTAFRGPDRDGAYRIRLAPMKLGEPGIAGVDFAVQFDDGTWDNRDGQDYHIPLLPDRIAFSPEQPTLNDAVRVAVRRSAPGGMLRWGVNRHGDVWNAPHPVYRPPGSRLVGHGEAVETPLPDPDERGECTLVLGPFDQGHQFVRSLHAVVRWGNTWDSNFGMDYNVAVSGPASGGPQVRFLAPGPGIEVRGDLEVVVEGGEGKDLRLWLDGEPLTATSDPSARHVLPGASLGLGPHTLLARVSRASDVAMREVMFWRLPPEAGHREPENPLRSGVTEHDDGTVTFALHAPGLRFVTLAGDFNDWDPEAEIMNLSSSGTWWLRRPLAPGTHRYQYILEGARRIADPYSHEVEWLDEEGHEASDSQLARSVVRIRAPAFEWPEIPYQRPALQQLIIYELHVQDFSDGRGFAGVTEKLYYLEDLGVTAIEPLPVTAFPGDKSWGYNPAFHFAPETSYGSPDDLRRLIAAAHARGMAVIIDMVLNHLDRSSALWQLYRHHYDASPYFRAYDGPNWGFPDLDQTNETFRAYAADVLEHWLTAYRADGFRYDATRWVGWQGFNDWGASWFAYAANGVETGSYQIAEHIPAEPLLVTTTEMDLEWDAHFRWRIREMLLNQQIEDTEDLARILNPAPEPYVSGFQRMVYIESHDESRFLAELLESGMVEEQALRRVAAAMAVLLTVPGVPMIYAGQEFGEITPKVVGPNPLHWDRLERPALRALHDRTRALLKLRTRHPALLQDGLDLVINDAERGIIAYHRVAGDRAVVTVVNVSEEGRQLRLPLPFAGTFREIGKTHRAYDGSGADVELGAGEALVLTGARAGS